ncbi:MAG: Gfo/Idh/MocA family oxidoreductase [Methanobacterium sp.]
MYLGSDKISKIKIGIVGLGAIAKKMHFPVLSSLDNVILDSVAEADVERGMKQAERWGIPNFYNNYEEMYTNSDIDAVFVCLPNFLHYDAVKKALENDINVFCEKPMGTNEENAFEVVKLAQKKDLVLAVGFNRRLEENFFKTRNIVKSLKLGTILQLNGTFVSPGPYGGWIPSSEWFFNDKYAVLYDSGSHLIDLLMEVISDRIIEVSATGISTMYGVDIIDNVSGAFKTENGIIGTFNIGWKNGANYDAIQIHGTGASIFENPMEIKFRPASYGPLDKIFDDIRSIKEITGKFIGLAGSTAKGPDNTYYKEDRNFLNAVIGKGKPCASGKDGLRVLEVLEAIKKSINNGKTVKVNYHDL